MPENQRFCLHCDGTGLADLPVGDTTASFPCPTCRPWANGFSGFGYIKADGKMHWIIKPYPSYTSAQ